MGKIYWDEGNGKVTTDSSYAPIIKNVNDIYIETYGIYGTNNRIDIAYTQTTKENENMYYFRKSILNNHGLDYCDLGKLLKFEVPNKVYKMLLQN